MQWLHEGVRRAYEQHLLVLRSWQILSNCSKFSQQNLSGRCKSACCRICLLAGSSSLQNLSWQNWASRFVWLLEDRLLLDLYGKNSSSRICPAAAEFGCWKFERCRICLLAGSSSLQNLSSRICLAATSPSAAEFVCLLEDRPLQNLSGKNSSRWICLAVASPPAAEFVWQNLSNCCKFIWQKFIYDCVGKQSLNWK